MFQSEKYKLGEAERGRISKDSEAERMEPRSFLGKETDSSEPQRRRQDDNWGPERIMLTKKPLKVARMYKRMQENITLARTIFKTY